MKQAKIGRASWWVVGALALIGLAVSTLAPEGNAAQPTQAKVNKYIGAAKCKNCHASEETGDQHAAWSKMEHAKAFQSLGTEEAKKFAAERGIADAQKDETCLKCHTTGFGAPPEAFDKKFDLKLGVQCETCHGPGEAHMKARMAAAMSEDPAKKVLGENEIVGTPKRELCITCHNTESPTYQPFCYFKRLEETRHLNPKKERSEAEKKALAQKCGCGDKCPTAECAEGKCGVDG
jgi:hypothetical protein